MPEETPVPPVDTFREHQRKAGQSGRGASKVRSKSACRKAQQASVKSRIQKKIHAAQVIGVVGDCEIVEK